MKKRTEIKVRVKIISQPSEKALSDFTNELLRLYNDKTRVNEQLEENAA